MTRRPKKLTPDGERNLTQEPKNSGQSITNLIILRKFIHLLRQTVYNLLKRSIFVFQ